MKFEVLWSTSYLYGSQQDRRGFVKKDVTNTPTCTMDTLALMKAKLVRYISALMVSLVNSNNSQYIFKEFWLYCAWCTGFIPLKQLFGLWQCLGVCCYQLQMSENELLDWRDWSYVPVGLHTKLESIDKHWTKAKINDWFINIEFWSNSASTTMSRCLRIQLSCKTTLHLV